MEDIKLILEKAEKAFEDVDMELALTHIDSAIEAGCVNYGIFMNKAQALYALERYNESISAYNIALIFDDNSYVAWYNIGTVYGHIGMPIVAIACYDKSINIFDKDAIVWCSKGTTLGRDLNNPLAALDCFERALEIDRTNKKAMQGKIVALKHLGQYEQAESFKRSLEDRLLENKKNGLIYN